MKSAYDILYDGRYIALGYATMHPVQSNKVHVSIVPIDRNGDELKAVEHAYKLADTTEDELGVIKELLAGAKIEPFKVTIKKRP